MKFTKFLTSACVLLAMLVMVGCSDSGGSTTGTKISGLVRDINGTAIVGATLKAGGASTVSIAGGVFSIENITPGASIIVEAKGPIGGATTYLSTQDTVNLVKGQTVVINFTLQEVGNLVPAVNVTVPAAVSDNRTDLLSAKVDIPANSLVTSTGTVVTTADIAVTTVLPKDSNYTETFPGLFVGNGAPGTSGDTQIVSYGYVDVTATSGGKELQLAATKTADISFPIDPANDPGVGVTQIEMWYLDEATGKWVYEGMAQRINSVPPVYKGTVSHFSPHNLDRPLTTPKDVTVTVTDGGVPVPGAIVTLKSNNAGSPAWEGRQTTGADGKTKFNMIPAGYLAGTATLGDRTGNANNWDSTTNTMDISLPPAPGPVEVTVVNQSNVAVSGVDVYLNTHGQAAPAAATKLTTGSNGKVTFSNVSSAHIMLQAVKISTAQTKDYYGELKRAITITLPDPPANSVLEVTVVEQDGTTPVPNAVVNIGLMSEGAGGLSIIALQTATTNANGLASFANAPEINMSARTVVGNKEGNTFIDALPTPPAVKRTAKIALYNSGGIPVNRKK